MSRKDFFKQIVYDYFIIVTLINVATCILGNMFRAEERFGYDAFLSPLIYGLISIIPMAVMYSKRELSVRELVIRKVFQLCAIEVVLLVFGYGAGTIRKAPVEQTLGFGLSILIIYVLVTLIEWWLNVKDARELTVLLKDYQVREKG